MKGFKHDKNFTILAQTPITAFKIEASRAKRCSVLVGQPQDVGVQSGKVL
jgi:hypothetical protein